MTLVEESLGKEEEMPSFSTPPRVIEDLICGCIDITGNERVKCLSSSIILGSHRGII